MNVRAQDLRSARDSWQLFLWCRESTRRYVVNHRAQKTEYLCFNKFTYSNCMASSMCLNWTKRESFWSFIHTKYTFSVSDRAITSRKLHIERSRLNEWLRLHLERCEKDEWEFLWRSKILIVSKPDIASLWLSIVDFNFRLVFAN